MEFDQQLGALNTQIATMTDRVEKRLSAMSDKVEIVLIANARIEESIKNVRDSIAPVADLSSRVTILEIAYKGLEDIRTLGWKSITSIVIAVITGGSALIAALWR